MIDDKHIATLKYLPKYMYEEYTSCNISSQSKYEFLEELSEEVGIDRALKLMGINEEEIIA